VEDATFSGLALHTAPGRVMVPRPASERLVAAAVARVGGRRARVADVGTGSGAIAVAIANACPGAEVWATDTSFPALALARANVRRHGLDDRVFVRHGDLLDPVPGLLDVIVANLPYVPASTAAQHLDLQAEPFAAVFAPGDGLDPYRRLVDAASTRLAEDGVLLLQLHGRLVAATRARLPGLRASLDGPAASRPTSGGCVESDLQAAA
jgi:release factor glutamine methyltransferase